MTRRKLSPRLAFSVALAAAMLAVALGANRGTVEAAPDPSGAYIHSIAYSGTGCPAGSVGQSLSSNRLSFTLIFDQFVASHGSGVPSSEWSKDCELTLSLFVPAGTADLSLRLDARGYTTVNPYHSTFSILVTDGSVDSLVSFEGTSRDYLHTVTDNRASSACEDRYETVSVSAQVAIGGAMFITRPGSQITTDSIEGLLAGSVVPCEPEDDVPPTIAVTSPVEGALYGLGAVIATSFTCDDADSGIDTCTGPAVVDTSAVGIASTTFEASDLAGNTASVTVSYTVGGKDECKNGGWQQFAAPAFRNQGQCVSHFARMR